MQAVILAEGEGVRLRPLTESMPKPLLRVAGIPLIQYNIELFEGHGVKDIIICTSYKREVIRQALGDGSQFGIKLEYSESEQPSGTAGALKKASWMLEPEKFFVANSDEIKEIDLYAMRRFHEDNEADATIALTKADDVSQFGVAKMEDKRIAEFVEKPKVEQTQPKLVNSGLYLFEPKVIEMIPNLPCYERSMLEKVVFPKLARMGRLFGFPFSGRWITVNTLEQYEAAEKAMRA